MAITSAIRESMSAETFKFLKTADPGMYPKDTWRKEHSGGKIMHLHFISGPPLTVARLVGTASQFQETFQIKTKVADNRGSCAPADNYWGKRLKAILVDYQTYPASV